MTVITQEQVAALQPRAEDEAQSDAEFFYSAYMLLNEEILNAALSLPFDSVGRAMLLDIASRAVPSRYLGFLEEHGELQTQPTQILTEYQRRNLH